MNKPEEVVTFSLNTPHSYQNEVLALNEREKAVVQIQDGMVKIDLGDLEPYEIALDSVKTEGDIVNWVSLLSVRSGVDLVTIRVFIEKMLAHLEGAVG